jgi:hypothetical protein
VSGSRSLWPWLSPARSFASSRAPAQSVSHTSENKRVRPRAESARTNALDDDSATARREHVRLWRLKELCPLVGGVSSMHNSALEVGE